MAWRSREAPRSSSQPPCGTPLPRVPHQQQPVLQRMAPLGPGKVGPNSKQHAGAVSCTCWQPACVTVIIAHRNPRVCLFGCRRCHCRAQEAGRCARLPAAAAADGAADGRVVWLRWPGSVSHCCRQPDARRPHNPGPLLLEPARHGRCCCCCLNGGGSSRARRHWRRRRRAPAAAAIMGAGLAAI